LAGSEGITRLIGSHYFVSKELKKSVSKKYALIKGKGIFLFAFFIKGEKSRGRLCKTLRILYPECERCTEPVRFNYKHFIYE